MKATCDEIELLIGMARQRPGVINSRLVERCRAGCIDWERFQKLAETERVAPIVWRNLLGQPDLVSLAPDGVARAFERSQKWNKAVKAARIAKTAEVARWFDQHRIRVMLIKGAALDQVIYEEPWLIASEDIDLIIDQELAEMPKNWGVELNRVVGETRKMEMECGRHHDLDLNRTLNINYDRLWSDARPLTLHGSQVWVMSPENLLLAASIQFWRRRFSRLKEALAIAEILNIHSNLDWTTLAEDARRAGADRIVATALVVVQSLLGYPIPVAAEKTLPIGPMIRISCEGLRPLLLTKADGHQRARRETMAGIGLKLLSLRPHQWRHWLSHRRPWGKIRKACLDF